MKLPKSLIKKLDFNLAINRVLHDMPSDFVINSLDNQIFKEFKDDQAKNFKKELLKKEYYEPKHLLLIDVPKKDYTLRPGAVCSLSDRLLYQALIDLVAEKVEKILVNYNKNVVFSYRLNLKNIKDKKMFIEPRVLYKKFIKHQKKLASGRAYQFVLVTDIAAYFERIYHHHLMNNLRIINCDKGAIEAIGGLLREWNEGLSYGIPQGMFPSDLLGNVYIHDIDSFMVENGYKYMRYVDDIKIFCKTELEARKALQELVRQFRHIGLNLQSAKTKIISMNKFNEGLEPDIDIKKVKEVITEKEIVKIDYFNEMVLVRKRKIIKPTTPQFKKKILYKSFIKAIKQPRKHSDLLSFCIRGFTYFRDSKAVGFILNNISYLPHLTSYFINYLTILPFKEKTLNNIKVFLCSNLNIYEWQEMHLLRYFFLAPKLTNDYLILVRNLFLNKNKHMATRVLAVMLLGKFGTMTDLRSLMRNYPKESDLWIRRSIAYSIYRLPKAERNHVYKYWERDDITVKLAIEYAKKKID